VPCPRARRRSRSISTRPGELRRRQPAEGCFSQLRRHESGGVGDGARGQATRR
jgi:hypothetical protein